MKTPGIVQFFRNIGNLVRSVPQKARHVVAWSAVKIGRALGMGYQPIKSVLIATGVMKRNSPFQRDVESYVNMLEKQASLIGMPNNRVPTFAQVVEFPFKRAEHFRWIVKITALYEGESELSTRYISLYTNRLMTPEELMANFSMFIRAGSETIQSQIVDYEVWALQHNPGAPWAEVY